MGSTMVGDEAMNRFFYQQQQRDGQKVVLQGEDAHHLSRVLRIQTGEIVALCDEQGVCNAAKVSAIESKQVLCDLLEPLADSEAKTRIDLAFGLLKGEKADFVLQKATELGAHCFLPFESERTIVKLARKKDARVNRWQKVVRSAAAQAQRAVVPHVSAPRSWEHL